MTADPKRQFAVDVVRKLHDAGFRALWAGGCVRDFLLGIGPKDYDVATDAVPKQVREIFGKRNTHAVGASFGVILVIGPKDAGKVEVATFRTDGSYRDGRRPDSVEFSTPEEDARRRDFTINGMFYDPLAQQVFDFVGGEADLSAGVIRAIGDPHDRVREDKLRMLRAVRFAATLDFELDPATADAVREMAAEIHVVSVERITQELKRMLVDRHRMRAMTLCRDVGLLHEFLPELAPVLGDAPAAEASPEWDVTLHTLQLLQDPAFELAAAALLRAVASSQGTGDEAVAITAGEICRRLKTSNEERDHVEWLLAHRHALDDAPQLSLCRLKRLMAHPLFGDLLSLMRAERIARNVDLAPVVFCEEYLRNTPREEIHPPDLLTGDDLIALGFTPGPQFKDWLTVVRDAQLNGDIATRDEAVAVVQRLQQTGSE
ncbi:MAG: CCA tRNA nucleotidyltransferase [Planctomycetaceae bacterium]